VSLTVPPGYADPNEDTVDFTLPVVNEPPGIGIANWGPLVCGPDIDQLVLSTMKTWAPTYLNRLRIERNLSFQPSTPRVYANTFAGQEFLDHRLPAVIVMTAQLAAAEGGTDRMYQGTWAVRMATVLRAKNPPSTRFLAGLYEGIFRRLALQKVRGAPIDSLHYQGMRYEEVPDATGAGRYSLAAISLFQAYTDQIVQPLPGPDQPDAETYLDEATITEVDIEVLGEQMPPITSGPGG